MCLFYFLIVNSSHTNTIKLYEVRHNGGLSVVTACELQRNLTAHIISIWWKGSLEQRGIAVWGEPRHQVVPGWGSVSAGHKPRLESHMWCQLAVRPKTCSFTQRVSHLLMYGYPFLPEWFGRFREAKIAYVWCKSRQQVPATWLPESGTSEGMPDMGRRNCSVRHLLASLVEWQVIPALFCPAYSVEKCEFRVCGWY